MQFRNVNQAIVVPPVNYPGIVVRAVKLAVLILCSGLLAVGAYATQATAASQAASNTTDSASPSCDPDMVVVASPNQGTADNQLNGVAIAGQSDVWAVGSHSALALIEHWNGTEWSVVPSPAPNSLSYLQGISVASSNDVWAVGFSSNGNISQTLIEHWNGAAWSVVGSPSPGITYNALYWVTAISPNDVWAVGSYNDEDGEQTLAVHWNGSAWTRVGSLSPNTNNILKSVSAAGPNDVWAVGSYYDGANFRTLIEHWNGGAWNVVSSPNPGTFDNYLEGVAVAGTNDVWAVGNYDDGSSFLTLTEHWNGTAWSTVSSPNPGSALSVLNGVAAAGPNDVWAVGQYFDGAGFQTLTEHWNGSAWSAVSSASPGADNEHMAVAAAGPNDVWAVGYSNQTGGSKQTLTEKYIPCSCSTGVFTDVPPGSTYHPYVTCLANRQIVGGYSDCTFRLGNPVTRGQLSKIVSLAAGFSENHTEQTFEDIPVGSTFYFYVERLASRSIVGGYACGGAGEPCGSGSKPYFRPSASVTRGQTSKIVAIAKGLPSPTPGQQTFQDVPTSSTFWQWIEELSTAGSIGGYTCGGPGEPCIGPGNKPYFRAANNITRGQVSKIVANTFFPNCNSTVK